MPVPRSCVILMLVLGVCITKAPTPLPPFDEDAKVHIDEGHIPSDSDYIDECSVLPKPLPNSLAFPPEAINDPIYPSSPKSNQRNALFGTN